MEIAAFNSFHSELVEVLADVTCDERSQLLTSLILLARGAGEVFTDDEIYRKVEFMEEQLKNRVAGVDSIGLKLESMCLFMKDEMGFVGNVGDYYSPKNSFINNVLSSGEGIPVSLACLYIFLANSINLQIEGVGFPCHFLIREKQSKLLIDPFEHRIVTKSDCLGQLKLMLGKGAALQDHFFVAVSNKQILLRFSGNLKEIFFKNKQYKEALRYCQLSLDIEVDEINNLFDRAQLFELLECYDAALKDFIRFKKLYPADVRIGMADKKIISLQSNASFALH